MRSSGFMACLPLLLGEGGTTHTSAALGLGRTSNQWKPADCDHSDDDDDNAGAAPPTATTTFHHPQGNQGHSGPNAPQPSYPPTAYPQHHPQQQQYSNGHYPPTAYPTGPYGGSAA